MKQQVHTKWRPTAVVLFLLVMVVATAGAVIAGRAGQEEAAVTRALWALLAFVSAWLLVLPAALR